MRYINKTNRHTAFDTFVKELKPRLKKWSDLKGKRNKAKMQGGEIQLALFQHLWQQQKGLCFYCQQEIPEKKIPYKTPDETIAQMEHICPQVHCGDLIFEQDNIGVSCEGFNLSEPTPTSNRRNFCGHYKDQISKGNLYDETLFLNPTEIRDIETYFEYDSQGKIYAADGIEKQNKASYMIKTLGLDNEILETMRQNQYDIWLEDYLGKGASWAAETLDEHQALLPAFHSMLRQKFL
jgi:uncharacterized protein (TIGR02646 family)